MLNKRVLIISNNALNKTNSNGRTLMNFFNKEDSRKIAQFYLHDETPDFEICQSYFYTTDAEIVKAFFKRKSAGKIRVKENGENSALQVQKKDKQKHTIKRTALSMLLRNFFWDKKCWRKKLDQWVLEFRPECILFQAGDFPFLYKLSREYAKKYNIPLIIYNSEQYYFSKNNYFNDKGLSSWFYSIFHRKLQREVRKTMPNVSCSIYISEELKELYDQEFLGNSMAIYTATELVGEEEKTDRKGFAYVGNLGLNRHKALIQVANILININPEYYLNVYGKLPNEEVACAVKECAGIKYHGFINYENVISILKSSRFLFHAESFSECDFKNIRYGFSTKIADSLASGACFIIFAPESLSCVKYLQDHNCACVITDVNELENELRAILSDEAKQEYYRKNALKTVKKNHDIIANQKKMEKLINSL